MSTVDKATETQLKNLQAQTGKTLAQLHAIISKSGLDKHGQIVAMLKTELGIGHGDANLLAHIHKQTDAGQSKATAAKPDDATDQIYSGKKAALRPIHDKLMTAIAKFGDFEIAPKKTYLSLRRKKQFAMIGPATQSQVEVGLNIKDLKGTDRLQAERPGGMCQFKVRVSDAKEVDRELLGWIKAAYDAAG
jgi:hypothetical protein